MTCDFYFEADSDGETLRAKRVWKRRVAEESTVRSRKKGFVAVILLGTNK